MDFYKQKHITTRKDHKCNWCGNKIKAGQKAVFFSRRKPIYEAEVVNDELISINQVGINYENFYVCEYKIIGECDIRNKTGEFIPDKKGTETSDFSKKVYKKR